MIRPIREDDAAAFLELVHALDSETSFMLFEPGERPRDVDEQRRFIATGAPTRAVWVAADGDAPDAPLAGFLGATRGGLRRNRHAASLVLGVRRAFWRAGLGSALMQALFEWAEAGGIRRIELGVMTHNHAAIALYLRHGFCVEGRRLGALVVDGAPVDEYLMARLS